MEFQISAIVLAFFLSSISGLPSASLREEPTDSETDVEDITNGTTYRFTNMNDESVITVLRSGDVISDVWKNTPEQRWTIVHHPFDPLYVEFKQAVVPYNMLSGYEPIPDSPQTFPRRLTLTKHRIMTNSKLRDGGLASAFIIPWQILIGNRWCLQANGIGRILDIDDCEYTPAPWQYFKLEVVEQ